MSLGGVSLVVSFCCFVLGPPLGIAAVVTGIIGLTQLRAAPDQPGKALAVTGICLGVLAILWLFVSLALFTLPRFAT